MDIAKLRLSITCLNGVYETPVFDSAAGGFVYVYGEAHLQKRRSAILPQFELGATGPG